ncbi:unnamed protein product [Rotaria sp. Silwood2]|nr:unnamed protein product [Rotaria sp. Silwood2]CAF2868257.1 unnamed protein product [Rotaria sp. Silwood2]CAF3311269.1 unnamed protein product [Rotaria sp. Silwood2]CAF4082144.1 unnamed protein product [Rotaria sp. Silwood2]CAF4125155.1 unnamed protein product [Rotaria sp. Silwood2]
MVTRPPNVIGYLHLGHAIMCTLEETISRWHRMCGDTVPWVPGCDHAVNYIYKQMKVLGSSCDWLRQDFTMDENISNIVKEAFTRMHEKKLIYRSTQLVNWSCTLKSAISDIEIEKMELKGRSLIPVPGYEHPIEFSVLIYFAYSVENSGEKIIAATSRLETMLGDTAVVVHPDDERYKDLHGKYVQQPFLQRRLPILTDTMVGPAFDSSAVKVTPAHDHK